MPTAPLTSKLRRTALALLSRDTLTSLSAHYDLDVGDRRVVANHVDALHRSRGIDFAELLARLSRGELKAICEALELPTDGREKRQLIDRILIAGATSVSKVNTAPPKINGKTHGMAGRAPAVIELDTSKKLSREQLERYL